MAAQFTFDNTVLGSFSNPFLMYFNTLNQVSQTMGPARATTRMQLESMGFLSRRAQAYLEIPNRLSKCRTANDIFDEQTRFWQTAFQQYMDSSRRIMDAWGQAMVPMAGFGGPAPQTKVERDYIGFDDPRNANGHSGPRTGDRRVA